MRVCPSCGYVDPIWWRPAAMHPEFSYAYLEDVETKDPELWSLLADKGPREVVERPPYVYWKSSRSSTVRRVWIEDFKLTGFSGPDMERVDHSAQTKLVEGGKPLTRNIGRFQIDRKKWEEEGAEDHAP